MSNIGKSFKDLLQYIWLRLKAYMKVFSYFVLYALLLVIVYKSCNQFLGQNLENKDSIALALSLVTFIGGLLGGAVLDGAKRIIWQPYILIETWQERPEDKLIYNNGDVYFRVRIRNISKTTSAKNCVVKVSLKFKPTEMEKVDFSSEECKTYWGTNVPFLNNNDQASTVEDESMLWDTQPNGERALELDIQPRSSYLITVARYRANGTYFDIPSEHPTKPRIWLKVAENLRDINSAKEYGIKIAVCGDNFTPISKSTKLKFDGWDPLRCVGLSCLRAQINIHKKAFPSV